MDRIPMPGPPSGPNLAVQHPIIDGFVQVSQLDRWAFCQICNGPGDPQDLVMGSSREPHIVHAIFEHCQAFAL